MQPDTIVLVHGSWVTPRAWENWITHYENKGSRVIDRAVGFDYGHFARPTAPPPRSRCSPAGPT
ncbi:lipase family protein [Streptomyces mirabilis]|uniref:hypothetical protein n=1 Tax=Streptomyces mirabilis TaxID=68239 RepID=UPI00331EF37C